MPDRLKTLDELLDALQKNDIATATAKSDAFFKDLSPRTALFIVRERGYQPFNDIIQHGEPFRTMALNFSALAQEGAFNESTDPAFIKGVIADLLGDDEVKSAAAFRTLKENIGEFGVQYLLEAWNSAGSPKTKAMIQIALREIGARAVQPMIAALDTKDALLKGMLIEVLSELNDWRAAAKLRELAVDKDLSDAMRAAARKTCERIVAANAGLNAMDISPSRMYEMLAEDYLVNRTAEKRGVIPRFALAEGARFFMWTYQNDALAFAEIPRFAYGYEMAISMAARALALDGSNLNAAGILVCARMAEVPAGQALIDYDTALNKTILTDKDRQTITATVAAASAKAPAAIALGPGALCRALDIAVENHLDAAAVSCMDAIAALPVAHEVNFLYEAKGGPAYGMSVIKAMSAGGTQVRFRAAITLARVSRGIDFKGNETMADLLLKAMESTSSLRVLIVHPDAEARNALSTGFKSLGCDVMTAENSAQGLAKAFDFPAPDVVVVTNELDRSTEFFVKQLRDNLATTQTPVLVVTTPDALQKRDKVRFSFENVKGFITNIADQAALKTLLASFKPVGTWATKENARILNDAAEVVGGSYFKPYMAKNADRLIALAQNNKALVARVAAMKALGLSRIEKALKPAGIILADNAAPKELRVAAAQSIGEILTSQKATSDETLGILLSALGSADPDISNAAGVALGTAPLTAEQSSKIPLK